MFSHAESKGGFDFPLDRLLRRLNPNVAISAMIRDNLFYKHLAQCTPPPAFTSPYLVTSLSLCSPVVCMRYYPLAIATKSEQKNGNEELLDVEAAPTGVELVQQFNYPESMFLTENASVRLKVNPGCLEEGQAPGPITVFTDKIYVVECDKQRFLVSVVVDCQPSGIKFNLPLSLDFRVREPPGQEGEDSNSSEDADSSDDEVNNEEREDYMIHLREEYMIHLRDSYRVSGFYCTLSQTKISSKVFPGIYPHAVLPTTRCAR